MEGGTSRFSPFMVGQKVVFKIPVMGRTNAQKFNSKYSGPFTVVISHDNGVTYEIALCSDMSKVIRAHYNQLRPWNDPPNYLSCHSYYRLLFPDPEFNISTDSLLVDSFMLSGPSEEPNDFLGFADSSTDVTTSSVSTDLSVALQQLDRNRKILIENVPMPAYDCVVEHQVLLVQLIVPID